MNMRYFLILVLFLFSGLSFTQVSIFEIQYTINPGSGTYPSPLEGQNVTVGGIVSANNYNNGNYFISSSNGGAWQGIFIYDYSYTPEIGDSIIISGEVFEYNGFTEIKNLTSFEILSNSNPLPISEQLSTYELSSEEAYESVYVEINDVYVTQTFDTYDEWHVDDGSGSGIIADAIFRLKDTGFLLFSGYPFSSIKGTVSYSYGKYMLHPRSIEDIISAPGAYIFSVNNDTIYENAEFDYSVWISFLGPSDVDSYELVLLYDPAIIEYTYFSQNGNLSSNGIVNDLSVPGEIHLVFDGNFSFSGIEEMITLKFIPLLAGSSSMDFSFGEINENPVQYFGNGQIDVNIVNTEPLGDTLTIIQKPILNIPEIVVPGESFEIICTAPSITSNWQAQLLHNDYLIELPITGSIYYPDLERWYLTATAPNPDIYELFDLKVTASGIIDDITRDAVHIIPQEKDSYYFVHITDTHLPTHYYYTDPQAETDTSEMVDLREVINDINLINPEFVLLTGDLINEGELEGFENRRYYSMAQRILTEFDVPVYLVSGNHDIGGWPETPVPDGSARHNWWRFFGWKWLQNPPVSDPYYTQNYSFDYGNTHYVGMEAYINYDDYMSDVYGNTSFTSFQLDWLDNDLLNAPPNSNKVLFYHMDFANQINLSEMETDMALYGHIHNNSGNIIEQPYNLATDNVCDGNRAYRIIRVNNGVFEPFSTSNAGGSGENLRIEFFPANNGSTDSVVAQITNNQNIDFDHARIKFVMPKGNISYSVINGVLEQVDNSGDCAICYVNVNIPANDIITVHIVADLILDLVVDIKALLEGPFDGFEMQASLNDATYLPLNQPYNTLPWNYPGNESVPAIPNADVVDWVLVELRDAPNAVSAVPSMAIKQQAAFVLMDGSIVGMDGSNPLSCVNTSINDNLFVVVYHRNHLAVMSASALIHSDGVYNYNFTTGANQAFENGAEGQKEIASGIWGMYCGDANTDGNISDADKIIWGTQAGIKGYKPSDLNMNGQVDNNDKNEIIIPNNNSQSQVPE